jgi:hypothetical protein
VARAHWFVVYLPRVNRKRARLGSCGRNWNRVRGDGNGRFFDDHSTVDLLQPPMTYLAYSSFRIDS